MPQGKRRHPARIQQTHALYSVDATSAPGGYDAMDGLNSERAIMSMPKSPVEAMDDFRFSNRMPSNVEAVRRLIGFGLEATAKLEGKR
jgi:hypothetical protein